jgi:amphi-Trp domain-containing protein
MIDMSEKVLMRSEEKRSRSEVATFLRDVASKISEGSLTVRQGSEEIVFEIPDTLDLELKVEEKTGRTTKIQFEIELEWLKDGKLKKGIEIV